VTAPRARSRRREAGVTLVELMVALVLGLVVAGAALAVFVANRQTYIATENIGRLQEGARVAFELMSRDLRQAAMVPCANEEELSARFVNAIDSTDWWNSWGSASSGIRGYGSADDTFDFGTGTGDRADGTDALEMKFTEPASVTPAVIKTAVAPSADITVTSTDGMAAGDALVACDYGAAGDRSAAAVIFQATDVNAGTKVIKHGATGATPGNDATKLTGADALFGQLQANGLVAELRASRWYIGHNADGGTSLYRSRLQNDGGTLGTADDEIVRGATGLALSYLVDDGTSYVDAATVGANWDEVVAIRIQLALESIDRVDGDTTRRTLEHVVTVRNRAL
jgi:type IV pilus assembly protein PilW